MVTMDCAEKTRQFQEYIDALEEERRKIEVFYRELPLSMHLISQAIDGYKQQMAAQWLLLGRSECEDTPSEEPVLEEFIPLKRSSSSEEQEKSRDSQERVGTKPDWLSSVRLWNQDPDTNVEDARKSLEGGNKRKTEDASHLLQGGEKKMLGTPTAAACSSAEAGRGREEREGQSNRKARRCWSPELHRRFLQALQQLGGSHAATPKQIREMMKVDGLTNDEVKSHLQKYRLHTRRPSPGIQNSAGSITQSAPFLVVGGIWVPPPEYATVAHITQNMEANHVAANGVYAPVATLPQMSRSKLAQDKLIHRSPVGPLQWDGRGSLEEDPATSSSSQTTSTFPAL